MTYSIPYPGGWLDFPSTSTPISASTLNAISNELASYSAAWASFAPTLTAVTTDPTLGTGALVSGVYTNIGKLVVARYQITFGTGAAAGSGNYRLSFPIASRSISATVLLGQFRLLDSSASVSGFAAARFNGGSIELVYPATYPTGTATFVGAAAPWTWADSDQIAGQIVYEAA